MLTASAQNGSSLFSEFASRSASWTSRSEGGRQSFFASDLANLVSAIQSGNTTTAQQYLTRIEKQAPTHVNSNSPLGQFFLSVSSALSNNDISGAQAALTAFENPTAPSSASASSTGTTPTSGSATAPSPAPSSSGTATPFTLGQDVLSLFTAIGSGDLKGAQSAYDTLTSLLLGGSSGPVSSSASTTSAVSIASPASTAAASGSPSTGASFDALLSQIGSALSTGDINSAQKAVDGFLQSLTVGSLIGVTA
jgi:hypothetical protein